MRWMPVMLFAALPMMLASSAHTEDPMAPIIDASVDGAGNGRAGPRFLFVGAVSDSDADRIPDPFDNCLVIANGPNNGSNQIDTDQDGYGNACDADCDQDGAVSASDFGCFLAAFGGPGGFSDHDGNGQVTVADFGIFLSQFGGAPGPSGLVCADPTLVVPPDAPCGP